MGMDRETARFPMPIRLYAQVEDEDEIRYDDYTSLYPWVNKYGNYPVGHPTFMYEPDTTNLLPYFGLAKCTILPPQRLYHPVLPYCSHDKHKFPLCRTCVEDNISKPLFETTHACHHTDDQRALVGTWCTPELNVAVQKGYIIQHVHEVWHFDDRRTGLFWSYVDTWLQIKEEASGWPKGCTTPAQTQAHVDAYYARKGLRLDATQIEKNPGLRALAKMMLNSMWGKFGQRINKTQVREFTDPQPFIQFLYSDQHDVRYVSSLTEDRLKVHYKLQTHDVLPSPNLNIFVAVFTTCHARLRLYRALDHLGERVLYFNTDSVAYLHRPGDPAWPVPRTMVTRTRRERWYARSMDLVPHASRNLIPSKEMPRRIHWKRDPHKDYRLVYSKRVLDPTTAKTHPYSYERFTHEDLDLVSAELFA
ncbi:uncharacterized protein [Montipora foliosa]|uniref:uncharacterized protein n=1 Tax=Montipora foliosa TaxID=591990 RepID=UPI0035F13192